MKQKTIWVKIQKLRLATRITWFLIVAFSIVSLSATHIIILLVASLLSGAWFCGWLCPLGSAQDFMGLLGKFLLKGKRFRIPEKADSWLIFIRYGLLIMGLSGWFIYTLLVGISTWLNQSYINFFSLIKREIIYLEAIAYIHLGIIMLLSLLIDRPFCRYVCFQGAQYGALSIARVFTIRRNRVKCIACKRCDTVCPVQINISVKKQVRNPQCINCFKCISSCPIPGVLNYGWVLNKSKGARR